MQKIIQLSFVERVFLVSYISVIAALSFIKFANHAVAWKRYLFISAGLLLFLWAVYFALKVKNTLISFAIFLSSAFLLALAIRALHLQYAFLFLLIGKVGNYMLVVLCTLEVWKNTKDRFNRRLYILLSMMIIGSDIVLAFLKIHFVEIGNAVHYLTFFTLVLLVYLLVDKGKVIWLYDSKSTKWNISNDVQYGLVVLFLSYFHSFFVRIML